MAKVYLEKNVYDSAIERISWTFDNFEKIYLSFSAGKDSTVMLHLVMDEDEVLRLTQITGLAEMFDDKEFSMAWEATEDDINKND